MLDDVSKQTSIRSDLQADFGRLRRGYEDEPYPEYSDRIARLSKLDALIRDNEAALVDALNTDFGCRSRTESLLAEILCSLDSIKYAKHNLAKWMRKRGRRTSFWALPAKIYARAQPLGVVGIMAPWNYSLDLTLSPLTAALAAGNRVMVCMSPETPTLYHTLSALIESVFTPSEVRIYLGSDDLSPAFAALPFDHLLFTGSTRVGRLVAKAAAENLTPITLELGGKSPAIVAPDFNITEAAERISWGKTFNAGQTCVAPDYVMIPKGSEDAFTTALLEKFTTSFHSMDDSDLTAVISERFYKRLTLMVEDAEAKGATILRPAGFEPTAKGGVFKMPLTVVMNPPEDATLMQEEIFGPVLPVLTYQAFSEVAAYVNAKERPLAVYCFSHNRSTIDHLQEQTVSGQFGLNETLIHYAQEDLAFGGVGSSGTGAYHGQAGFDTFSHLKSVLEQRGFFGFTGLKLLHPPYGRVTNLLVSLMKR